MPVGLPLTKAQRKQLKAAREALGLSQPDVADTAGISQSLVCFVERGDKNPSLETLQAICQASSIRPACFDEDIKNLNKGISAFNTLAKDVSVFGKISFDQAND